MILRHACENCGEGIIKIMSGRGGRFFFDHNRDIAPRGRYIRVRTDIFAGAPAEPVAHYRTFVGGTPHNKHKPRVGEAGRSHCQIEKSP